MESILYTLIYLVIINFYLILTKRTSMPALEKFMLSLMSIFVLFVLFQLTAYLFAAKFAPIMNPTFNIIFTLVMLLVMPVISTEIVLSLYTRFIVKKKK